MYIYIYICMYVCMCEQNFKQICAASLRKKVENKIVC